MSINSCTSKSFPVTLTTSCAPHVFERHLIQLQQFGQLAKSLAALVAEPDGLLAQLPLNMMVGRKAADRSLQHC